MEVQGFLYEALSPLSLSTSTHPPLDSESYQVFRNEISLSAVESHSPAAAAPDYFSLALDADETTVDSIPVSSVAATPVKEPEKRLEGGWFRANCRFRSPMLQLHKEILDFCNFLSPTPEEQASRNTAVQSVFEVIHYIWPNCKVEVFGSFKTGLYLPTSDIDVVILGSDIRSPQMGLQALARALSQRGVAKKIQVIAKARVPIIKFVEKRSGVAFDISFDLENGPKAAEFIEDAISKWPPLRPLCLILKVFLQQRELNEVYTGGIGSYALLTMLMAMLRSVHEQQAAPEHNLGVLLVHFFDIYGRKLNTSDVGVSCNGEGTFFLKSTKGFTGQGKPFLLAIQDPQLFSTDWLATPKPSLDYPSSLRERAPENDVGKNSYSYFQVKSAFSMAFSTLTNAKTIFSLGPSRSILGTIIRPDTVLLERKGGSNGEMTFNNLLPGAGEPLQANFDGQQEIYCNWKLDDEEEPLPRGKLNFDDGNTPSSSGKKRKASKEEKRAKKAKENGEESGSRKEKGKKKRRWRDHGDGSHNNNGFSRYGGSRSPWSRTS